MTGSLRIEKEVDIERENFWPLDSKHWQSNKIVNRVIYKIEEIKKPCFFGEK